MRSSSFIKAVNRSIRVTTAIPYLSKRNMADSVHITAKEGFTQGEYYDQNRPSYTDQLVAHVVDRFQKKSHEGMKYNVLELGAGTGKFTKKIATQFGKGCQYMATDPSSDFMSVLKAGSPDVETAVCSALDLPLPDNSIQNIVGAQCFHWFASEASLNEIYRVLIPGGRLIFVWNNKDWDVQWLKEMEDVLTLYYSDTPRAMTKKWKTVIEQYKPLKFVEHSNLPGIPNMTGNKDFVISHFASISVIARLDASDKPAALAKFKAVLDKHFTDDEEIRIPFNSEFYCTEKV